MDKKHVVSWRHRTTFAEGGTELPAAVSLRDTLWSMADLTEMVDGLSQGPESVDRIGRKSKQHGQGYGLNSRSCCDL